jgi:hypothetical protein
MGLPIFLGVLAALATAVAYWIWNWTTEFWSRLYTRESEVVGTSSFLPLAFPFSLARSVPSMAVGAWLTVVAEAVLVLIAPEETPPAAWLVLLSVVLLLGPTLVLSTVVYFWGRPTILVPPAARKPRTQAIQLEKDEQPLIQEQLELRESRLRIALRAIGLVIVFVASLFVARNSLLLWVFGFLCLAGAVMLAARQIFWRQMSLHLTRQGFAWRTTVASRSFRWTEVGPFYRRPLTGEAAFQILTSGKEVTLRGLFGKRPAELVTLMNAWRDQGAVR